MSVSKVLSTLFLVFWSISSWAQQASVSGVVRDSSGLIIGASVTVLKFNKGSITDENGQYHIKDLVAGNYVLRISNVGMLSQNREIRLQKGQSLKLDFLLKPDPRQLTDVTVQGKSRTREIKESAFTVNAIDIKPYANTTADMNQVLNRSTGVRIREQGGLGSNFNFSLNGLSGKAVKYFIDGVPIEVFGSAMSLNNIPVNLAERIDVFKGVVPVDLGSDAMGGAINVVTNKNLGNYLDLSHSYGSFNTHRSALNGQFFDKKRGLMARGSAFFNYSDNDYLMRDVEVLEGGTRVGKEITDLNGASFVTRDVRRFHDQYRSGMGQVELGLVNKSWADALFFGFSYNDSRQDLQTGFEQKTVYGMVERKSHAYSGMVRYKKDNLFVKGLNLNLFASRAKDTYVTTDTLERQYYWDGYWTSKGAAEMGGIKQVSNIVRPRTFGRLNLSYRINDEHSLNLNYSLDHVKNENFNALHTNEDDLPGRLNKQILGFAYQQELMDKRLVNTFFAKIYHLGMDRKKYVNNAYSLLDTALTNYGYGVASRFKLLKDMGLKASFERSYRLQEVEEMFGDGLNLQPNPDLMPESSYNVNVGAYYGFTIDKHTLFFEAGGFYRNAKDFIFPVPDVRSGALKNENKSNVRVTGFEAEARYNYSDLIGLNVNATYQNAVNTTRNNMEGSSIPEATYMNKIPNQPWFFGNADLTLGKNDVLGKGTRLQFNWFTQYVHWFYLSWEAFGNANGKSTIPSQVVHNASLTCSLNNGRYNITGEVRNLSDNLAFDNFRLQKPGRAFYLKLRYFIK